MHKCEYSTHSRSLGAILWEILNQHVHLLSNLYLASGYGYEYSMLPSKVAGNESEHCTFTQTKYKMNLKPTVKFNLSLAIKYK